MFIAYFIYFKTYLTTAYYAIKSLKNMRRCKNSREGARAVFALLF
jgi:hypothetical protein